MAPELAEWKLPAKKIGVVKLGQLSMRFIAMSIPSQGHL
jgi:hypothetical protein